MKTNIVSKTIVAFIAFVGIFTSCVDNEKPQPVSNDNAIPPSTIVTPGPSTACGITINDFKENTLTYKGSCYTLRNVKSGLEQGYWLITGDHPLSTKDNFLQCNVYFNERPYSNGEFVTSESPNALGTEKICIVINDYSNYDETKSIISFISGAGQKVSVTSTGSGVIVKFDNINFISSSEQPIKAMGHIKSSN